MSKAPPPSRLFGLVRGRAMAPAIDPADLGTAFGLDLSMSPLEPAPAPVARSATPGWMQRLRGQRPARN